MDTSVIKIYNPVNEGLAMGIAVGSYLSTGQIPILLIQNSGLLNTLNALTSLNQIYEIPVLYLISWRGEGGVGADAPEHDIVGGNLEKILDTFQIPYEIIDDQIYRKQLARLTKKALKSKLPVALIIKNNTFSNYDLPIVTEKYGMTRLEAIQTIKKQFSSTSLFISSTGYPSRDSFNVDESHDFYLMGSMGHTFSVALGVAGNTKKRVVVLDGDGSALMHVGGLASYDPLIYKNILYIVLDNEVCESTGCQPTVSYKVNYKHLSKAFGFQDFYSSSNLYDLKSVLSQIQKKKTGSSFLHIKINYGSSQKSRRVSDEYTPVQVKENFMKEINK